MTEQTMAEIEHVPSRTRTGWGCVVCHLPSDGAVAVLCDYCLGRDGPPNQVCRGYPMDGDRTPFAALDPAPFDHDPRFHPETREGGAG